MLAAASASAQRRVLGRDPPPCQAVDEKNQDRLKFLHLAYSSNHAVLSTFIAAGCGSGGIHHVTALISCELLGISVG